MNEKQCRALVKERADGLCERCGFGGGQTLHHRKKRSHLPKQFQWQAENCVMVCGDGTRGCHGWIEAHPLLAGEQGFHVASWKEPLNEPIHYLLSSWALLKEDGTVEFV